MAVSNLTINRLAGGGDGIGRLPDGKVCFVPFTAPGDQIEVSLVSDKKNFARGRLHSLLAPGPGRTEPKCSIFGRCGGCSWQHLRYPAQLDAKNQLVRDHMARFYQGDTPVIHDIIASPEPWHYRSRLRFHMHNDDFGFFAAGSHHLIPVADCPIAAPDLLPKAQMQHKALQQKGIRRAEFEVRSDATQQISVAGCTLVASAESFTQVNLAINDLLVRYVLDLAGSAPRRILDLYSGIGNLGLPLASKGHTVTGIEQSASATQDARDNAKALGLEQRSTFICAEAAQWLKDENPGGFDLILLDPPRSGAAACLPHLPKTAGASIIYVSCDLPTLTRDLNTLHNEGYKTTFIQPFDMFPQTAHMELVACLESPPVSD